MMRRYEVLEVLGRGVFGEVLRVKDHLLDKIMACKLYIPAYKLREGQHPQTQLFFLHSLEIEYQNLLTCIGLPTVVIPYELTSWGPVDIMLLENIEGTSLEGQILPEESIRLIIADLCLTVYHMHRRGVVHRDIHASNVMRDNLNQIKLIDFGYSIDLPFGEKSPNQPFEGRNDEAAPEFYQQEDHDYRVDYWGIGCLIYQLLTGEKLMRMFVDDHQEVWSRIESESLYQDLALSTRGLDFLRGVLTVDRESRLIDEKALYHPWISSLVKERESLFEMKEYVHEDLIEYIDDILSNNQ